MHDSIASFPDLHAHHMFFSFRFRLLLTKMPIPQGESLLENTVTEAMSTEYEYEYYNEGITNTCTKG